MMKKGSPTVPSMHANNNAFLILSLSVRADYRYQMHGLYHHHFPFVPSKGLFPRPFDYDECSSLVSYM